jgi:anti-repressor protein
MTIPMAKEICMIQRSEKGKQARQYFLKLEEAWNTPEMVMARALKMADLKIYALKTDNSKLTAEIEILLPKANNYDTVMSSDGALSMSKFAKSVKWKTGLRYGSQKLYALLREKGIIQKTDKSCREPYEQYVKAGYFSLVEFKDPYGHIDVYSKVTPKGVDYLVNKFRQWGLLTESGAETI